ncbi:MAG: hypothetical protein M3127_01510 [Actinomycetota bacterium]|nr:hypothetical protein [Actinomycetota bacterium]
MHAPGPEGVKLPISGLPLAGRDADPSTITNFNGFAAMAAVTGEVVGSDDKTYPMETDIRVFKGTYRAADGTEHNGVFAFI